MRGLELPYPQYKIAMVTGYVLSRVCDWLESEHCPAKRKLSLGSTDELMSLVKTFLGSKMTVYGMTRSQLDHLSSILLQASSPTTVVALYSLESSNCCVHEGLWTRILLLRQSSQSEHHNSVNAKAYNILIIGV